LFFLDILFSVEEVKRNVIIALALVLAFGGGILPQVTPLLANDDVLDHWHFDERSGTTAYDSSGNGKNGTIWDGATWVEDGKINGGSQFCALRR
jgi:hypothetical protein